VEFSKPYFTLERDYLPLQPAIYHPSFKIPFSFVAIGKILADKRTVNVFGNIILRDGL
jgi:hypothetical protein